MQFAHFYHPVGPAPPVHPWVQPAVLSGRCGADGRLFKITISRNGRAPFAPAWGVHRGIKASIRVGDRGLFDLFAPSVLCLETRVTARTRIGSRFGAHGHDSGVTAIHIQPIIPHIDPQPRCLFTPGQNRCCHRTPPRGYFSRGHPHQTRGSNPLSPRRHSFGPVHTRPHHSHRAQLWCVLAPAHLFQKTGHH